MGLVDRDDGWRMPDWLWVLVAPLLPAPPPHPLGCHRPRVPDRDAMDAILLVLRTGMQWNALNGSGICSSSSAHRDCSGGAGSRLVAANLVVCRGSRRMGSSRSWSSSRPPRSSGSSDGSPIWRPRPLS